MTLLGITLFAGTLLVCIGLVALAFSGIPRRPSKVSELERTLINMEKGE